MTVNLKYRIMNGLCNPKKNSKWKKLKEWLWQ